MDLSIRPDLGFHDEGCDLLDPTLYVGAAGAAVLPPLAYRSPAFARLEDEALWTRSWICVGTQADVPAVGDLLPFTVGTHGVHVQRTAEGNLAGRFNKAQHGGCRAVPLQCQGGTKTSCSFTSCGHSRDRGPIAAGELGDGEPAMHQYLGLRPERLLPVAVGTWEPLVFVSLAADPAPLAATFAGVEAAAPFFGHLEHGQPGSAWIESACNWKLAGVHLLAGSDDLAAAESCAARALELEGAPVRGAWLFPNLLLFAQGPQTCVVILQPTATGRTLCRVSVHGPGGAVSLESWRERLAVRLRRAAKAHLAVTSWHPALPSTEPGQQLLREGDDLTAWMHALLARRIAAVRGAVPPRPVFAPWQLAGTGP